MPVFIQIMFALFLFACAPAILADEGKVSPDPLNQIRAEHVMISTDSYAATVEWYRSVLGFRVTHQWTVPELPGLKLGYLERNGFVIEVVETPTKSAGQQRPQSLGAALDQRGFGHLAFLVADVDAVHDALLKKNVDVLVPPTSFPDAGRRLIFVFDNNGTLLEFLTPLSAYQAASKEAE